jgi:hypothetical protein
MARKGAARKVAGLLRPTLNQGGQVARLTGRADIYERHGTRLEQINTPGVKVKTRVLLSGRIRLNDTLRGVGNVYGASAEEIRIGLSGEFLPEIVDGGQKSAGGITPHLVAVAQRVRFAQAALADLPTIRHRATSQQGAGPHRPLTHRDLIDTVCVEGTELTEIALRYGWYIRGLRKDGTPKYTIPKQQSQKLKAALVDGLEAIETTWRAEGIDISGLVGGVEVG